MSKEGTTIWQMVDDLGPIVYVNEELGAVITANGSYLNWWCGSLESGFTNTDCLSLGENIMDMKLSEVVTSAEVWASDVLNELDGMDK